MRKRLSGLLFTLALLFGILPAVATSAEVVGTDITYTTDADFDQGTLVSVNHDAPFSDQLQLDSPTEPFPFINVAASGRGTVVRVNTDTGEVVGEYRTAPEGRGLNPSRTTVDLFGNVWTANREEVEDIDRVPHGSAVKIGLIVGGTRVDSTGTPDPDGGYLAPPFGYSTCIDRNGDGLIRTSKGLLDVLDWPDLSDGPGGADGIVEDAIDECVLLYQRLPNAEQARHVSVDADNNVWVGGFPFELRMFHKLDGATGAILDSFDAADYGCGGYGGLVDGNGVVWSVGWGTAEGSLLRYDPSTRTGSCINTHGGYGIGIDTNGYVWTAIWNNGIAKVSPDGELEPGFPKSTSPTSSTTSTAAAGSSGAALYTASTPVPALQPIPAVVSPLSAPMPLVTPMAEGDPNLGLRMDPDNDWVETTGVWPAGATVTLTIEDGSGVVFTDSQIVDSGGYFFFNLWETFDLQRGHVVTVSDGTATKTHTVTDLYVDGINVVADTVFGRADPGTGVHVWVHGDGEVTVTADGSGNWTADFSGITDLTYNSDGGSEQSDDDGDSTGVWWSAPTFWVSPDGDWVQSSEKWTAGATISLTIEDGSGVVNADSQTADSGGHFEFNLGEVFDLQRGHIVTVSDGTTTKTHTVTNLFVDGINVTADTVFGRADAGAVVDVWAHEGGNVTATADGSGNWTADFSALTDLTYNSDGGSQQSDADGDSTGVWWSSPKFQVSPDDDWVQSSGPWTPNAAISLTIEDGSGIVYSDSQTTDSGGHFNFSLWNVFDVQRGHLVTVSDGATTKAHKVMDLFVDGINVAADTVFGTAAAGSAVDVWVHDDGNVTATADGSGNWTADFSAMTDITYLSDGGSQQSDADGDSTGVWWSSPKFQVSPDDDWVQSSGPWTPNAAISLTIVNGSGIVYSDSQAADSSGYFNFDLWDTFDILTGHVATITDGSYTKVHIVTDVSVDDIDTGADTVGGASELDASVSVEASLFEDWSVRWVQADALGDWTADFSEPWQGQPSFDITDATFFDVTEYDDDGDGTYRSFGPPVQANRGVAVTPIDNHVWVANSGVGTVTRLDNDGIIVKVIETGDVPTGVAVDAAGKVWATNLGSDNTVRIDPDAGSDGLGSVDLTVDLGNGASPYNYSDMTGAVVVGSTSPQGFWTLIQDSGVAGFEWGRITWNTEPEASEPDGTAILVEVRTADSEAGLGGEAFTPVVNGELFSSIGRYIEVRTTLKASSGGFSPVLSDIRVQPAMIEVDVDIKPGSDPNSINVKRTTGVIPVAVLGTVDFEVVEIDVTTLGFGPDLAIPAHDLTNVDTYADHLEDVNDDGFMDLVSHYVVGNTGLARGDTEACLIGETLSGIPIEGCDSVRILGKP